MRDIDHRLSNTPEVANSRRMARIRRWSNLMDAAFKIPGTRFRFGWDALIGLVPGVGDAATALFSLFILVHAFRIRVPGVVRARMFINVIIDLVVGTIPLVGDLFDFAWKANTKNLELLERHAMGVSGPTAADWTFVLGSVTLVMLILAIPVLALAALLASLPPGWTSPSAWRLLMMIPAF